MLAIQRAVNPACWQPPPRKWVRHGPPTSSPSLASSSPTSTRRSPPATTTPSLAPSPRPSRHSTRNPRAGAMTSNPAIQQSSTPALAAARHRRSKPQPIGRDADTTAADRSAILAYEESTNDGGAVLQPHGSSPGSSSPSSRGTGGGPAPGISPQGVGGINCPRSARRGRVRCRVRSRFARPARRRGGV